MNLDVVRETLSVSTILDAFGLSGKLRNGWYRLSQCPRCNETSSREAIAIEARSGRWLHHGCERGAGGECSGDIFDLIAACTGLDTKRDFVRVLEECSKLAGGIRSDDPAFIAQIEQRRRQREAEELRAAAEREVAETNAARSWPHMQRRHVAGELYLAGRGLDVHELIRLDAVRFSYAGDPCVALFSSNGIVTSIATRFVEPGERPKVVVRKGTGTAGSMIHPICVISPRAHVVIVEGVIDALTARLAWPSAVILGANGAGNVPELAVAAINRIHMTGARVSLVPHHDDPGVRATARAATVVQAAGARFQIVDLPRPDLNAAYADGWRTMSTAYDQVIAIVRSPHSPSAEPLRLAETFRKTRFEMNGHPLLVRWARTWWHYNGVRYVEHDEESLARDLIDFLDIVTYDAVNKKTQAKTKKRVTARRSTVVEVKHALLGAVPVLEGGAPQWTQPLDGDPEPTQLVPCANGLLDLKKCTVSEPTPRLFATQSLAAEWKSDAQCPHWHAFLEGIWGDDRESIRALQQLFGYLISPDTNQHKLFAIVGPKRSGKSTIGRVIKALLGDDATVNPTLSSLERPFGLAPLVGKSVAIIGDARLGGKADQASVVERLLSISGEDPISIDRKNRDPINVRLRTRVLLLSNELPRLYDTSGALASRFVILQTSKSFYGEEDLQLEQRLLAELDGILAWAVEGYHDLHENGRFITPAASRQAQEELEAISSPITVFIADRCKVGPEYEIECSTLYERWTGWCESQGREPGNAQCFGRDLRTYNPAIKLVQHKVAGGARPRFYQGGLSCLSTRTLVFAHSCTRSYTRANRS